MDKKKFGAFLLYATSLVLIIFLLWKIEIPIAFFKKLFEILRPVFIGGAIAFVLNRPLVKIQELFLKIPQWKKPSKKERTLYIPALITTYVLFFAIVVGIVWFIVPQLVESVTFFAESFDTYYANFMIFFNKQFGNVDFSFLDDFKVMDKLYEGINSIVDKLPTIISATFDVTANIIGTVVDIFIGLIFSVYILVSKKKLKRQTDKLFYAACSEKNYNKVRRLYVLCSNTFSSFINGQLTEACILGILCFIGMKIFDFDYAVLISVIIGLTNLIPIFGPIIGTIPCALILLLVNPIDAVWFVVYIIILQQLESNLIYPRVVGNSVGLAPLWTLTAIIVGGGLFGIWGMILGIPAMSVLYTLIGEAVNKKVGVKNELNKASCKRE